MHAEKAGSTKLRNILACVFVALILVFLVFLCACTGNSVDLTDARVSSPAINELRAEAAQNYSFDDGGTLPDGGDISAQQGMNAEGESDNGESDSDSDDEEGTAGDGEREDNGQGEDGNTSEREGNSEGENGGGGGNLPDNMQGRPMDMRDDDEAEVTFYMHADGTISELDELAVYSEDDEPISEGAYTLEFEEATIEYSYPNAVPRAEVTWEDIDRANITEEGLYRVHAQGKGAYSDTSTRSLSFEIVRPEPETKVYNTKTSRTNNVNVEFTGYNLSKYLGYSNYEAASILIDGAPAYSVIVPSANWENQLLGVCLAGASEGPGIVLFDCGTDEDGEVIYDSEMMQAFLLSSAHSDARSYIIVGSEEAVPQSIDVRDEHYLSDFAECKRTQDETSSGFMTRYGEEGQTAHELASSILDTFKAERWGAEWGSIALVASPSEELIDIAAEEYAYLNATRLFFLQADGTLADEDLEALCSEDITDIVLVGDSSCVSDSVMEKIESATEKTPSRILEGDTATDASLELAQQLVDEGTCSFSTVIIADTTEPANVASAAVLAAATQGIMLTCTTSADAEKIASFFGSLILKDDLTCVEDMMIIGDFDYLDLEYPEDDHSGSMLGSYFSSAWSDDYNDLSEDITVTLKEGDTFEVRGFVYEVTGTREARLVRYVGSEGYRKSPSQVVFNKLTYSISSE